MSRALVSFRTTLSDQIHDLESLKEKGRKNILK